MKNTSQPHPFPLMYQWNTSKNVIKSITLLLLQVSPVLLLLYFLTQYQTSLESIVIFLILNAIGSQIAIRAHRTILTVNCGTSLAGILLHSYSAVLIASMVEVLILHLALKTSKFSKSLLNYGIVAVTIFLAIEWNLFLATYIRIPTVLLDITTALGYWLINMFVCSIGVYLGFGIDAKQAFLSMIREGNRYTFILLLMLGILSARLYQAQGFGYLIPIFIVVLIISREFHPVKIDLGNHYKPLTEKLRYVKSFQELKSSILQDIVDRLNVESAAIVRVNPLTNKFEYVTCGPIRIKEYETLKDFIKSCEEIKTLHTFEINDESVLIIDTKSKYNSLNLKKAEIEWLQVVSTFLAISIDNLDLIRQLSIRLQDLVSGDTDEQIRNTSWLEDALFTIQERERERIAADIHDTVLQDLMLVKRRINRFGEGNLAEEKMEIIDQLDTINVELRRACIEVYPQILTDIGFVGGVQSYINSRKNQTEFDINVEFKSLYIENMSDKVKLHLFRIVQELLNNAIKYMNGTNVQFLFDRTGEKYVLLYTDNGNGFSNESLTIENIEQRGLGFRQLKQRLKTLNGDCQIESNNGLSIKIEIPIGA